MPGCNHIHVTMGRCVLALGHEGPHEYIHPENTPRNPKAVEVLVSFGKQEPK